jgi:small subunit ribosomal protein S20
MEVAVPHKKSAVKRRRQDEKLNVRNKAVRSQMTTAVKKAQTAPEAEREAATRAAVSAVDKAAKVKAIKKATADRKKSRLMKAAKRS